jgi:hypothetical protein
MGLQHLLAMAEVEPDGLTEEHISYDRAASECPGSPGGRQTGGRILTTQDPGSRLLATQLEGLNAQRRRSPSKSTRVHWRRSSAIRPYPGTCAGPFPSSLASRSSWHCR